MAQALWQDVAAAYDRSFASLCAGSAESLLARVPEDARVLDVGCGSGHVTAALAGAGRDVRGVDPDPEMVALAASRAAADVQLGALPDLPFENGSFDAVVANFVLNHVDDPRSAARGLSRVLRPGGVVVATIWPAYVPPHGVLWSSVLDACGAARPEMPRLAPELDFERSPSGLGDVLEQAGLEVAEATLADWGWRVRPADLMAGFARVGNFGVVWRAQTPEMQDRLSEAFDEAAAPWLNGDQLVFPVSAVLVRATA